MKIKSEPLFVTTADGKELDINKYLPLVKHIVYKVSSRLIKSSELYLDLQSAGYVGLLEAAKNYDTTKAAFTTFAYSHIKGRILRALTHESEEDHTLNSPELGINSPEDSTRFTLRPKDFTVGRPGEGALDVKGEDQLHMEIDAEIIDAIINKLFGEDSVEKKILTLKYKENKVFMDIGKELGIHYKTAETKHKKAISKLRSYIIDKKRNTRM